MWQHLTQDEAQSRLKLLERYAEAGVPDAAIALGVWESVHGDREVALDWWSRPLEPRPERGADSFFLPRGRVPKNKREGYGGMYYGRAAHPRTPTDELWVFARDEDEETRMEVAVNPACPEKLIRDLAMDPSVGVRLSIVSNPSCPPDLLEALMWNRDDEEELSEVHWAAIAQHPRCPEPVMRAYLEQSPELALTEEYIEPYEGFEVTDEFAWVLASVAENFGVPTRTLQGLAGHSMREVRAAVAGNAVAPPHSLTAMARDADVGVRAGAAGNLSLDPGLFAALAVDDSAYVRAAVHANPGAPESAKAAAQLVGF